MLIEIIIYLLALTSSLISITYPSLVSYFLAIYFTSLALVSEKIKIICKRRADYIISKLILANELNEKELVENQLNEILEILNSSEKSIRASLVSILIFFFLFMLNIFDFLLFMLVITPFICYSLYNYFLMKELIKSFTIKDNKLIITRIVEKEKLEKVLLTLKVPKATKNT